VTNLDKIKAMSAEDLAEYIINFNRCSKCVHYNKEEFECGYLETPVPCIDGVTKWLNQEVNPMPKLECGDVVETRHYALVALDFNVLVRSATKERMVLNDAGKIERIWRVNSEGEYEVIWRAES
jgi:hypothetical protein